MCYQNCFLPTIKNGYCPIHFVQKEGSSKLDKNCLHAWVSENQRYAKFFQESQNNEFDPELADLHNSEVYLRNQALTAIYGRLPSYAYFSCENEFAERDWVDWWQAVLKDVEPDIQKITSSN